MIVDAGPAYDGSVPPGVPPNPGGPTPNGTGSTVLAMSKIYYGDTDRSGVFSQDAWRQYGMNIDGNVTTASSTDTCTLGSGASKSTQVDGTNGIDNSFGENIMPILLAAAGASYGDGGVDPSHVANTRLQQGDATELVRLDALGSGPNYAPLPGAIYRAAPTATAPPWNGSEVRDVDVAYTNGSSASPSVIFGSGYMSQRTWVGEPPTQIPLDLHFAGGTGGSAASPLTVRAAQLTMLVAQNNASATQGVIAGVLDTQEFIDWLKPIAGNVSISLCTASAFDSIAQQILQAADIVLEPDGTVTNDASVACNAISIGLGFDATAVTIGNAVSVPVATPTPVCGD
jgi:hypothetical protein